MIQKILSINNKWIFSILIFLSVNFLLVSCTEETYAPSDTDKEPELYDHSNQDYLSLLAGNLHFGGFITSDSNFIYYISKDNSGLIKSEYNGNNRTVLSNKLPGFISVAGDMVYYTDGHQGGSIFKVNNSGEGESIVKDAVSTYIIPRFDFIYYIDTNSKNSFRIKHDGSNTTKIINYTTDEIILFGGKIYMLINDITISSNSLVVEIDLDFLRTINSVITYPFNEFSDNINVYELKGTAKYINVNENYLFFSQNGMIFRLTKSNNRIKNTGIKISSPFILSGKYVYFINEIDNSRIYRFGEDNFNDLQMIVNDKVYDFSVCGNSIYYRRVINGDIYRTSSSGSISSKITWLFLHMKGLFVFS